ncbi:hypothetical protein EZS27_021102 [termite gut metagenome]|uniref:Uncharacterized protein n=1 Tax=termite gut metagenome TaxID=433724 RepID=A0A5J4R9Y6_9ZZZZ
MQVIKKIPRFHLLQQNLNRLTFRNNPFYVVQ